MRLHGEGIAHILLIDDCAAELKPQRREAARLRFERDSFIDLFNHVIQVVENGVGERGGWGGHSRVDDWANHDVDEVLRLERLSVDSVDLQGGGKRIEGVDRVGVESRSEGAY